MWSDSVQCRTLVQWQGWGFHSDSGRPVWRLPLPPVLPSRRHSQKCRFGLFPAVSGAGCLPLSVGLWCTADSSCGRQIENNLCGQLCQEGCLSDFILDNNNKKIDGTCTQLVFIPMLKWARLLCWMFLWVWSVGGERIQLSHSPLQSSNDQNSCANHSSAFEGTDKCCLWK